MSLVIAIVNFFVCVFRFYSSVKSGRLISVCWFLISYFAFAFIFVAFEGPFNRLQGFTGVVIKIKEETILDVAMFMFAFNCIFMFVELLIWRAFGSKTKSFWSFDVVTPFLKYIKFFCLLFLLVGSILYGITSYDHGYRDYVEFKGSSWGLVFLWAGSPFIVISALYKKYVSACLAVVPFLYFAVHLNIRSFFLLSLIPLLTVYFFQLMFLNSERMFVKFKIVFGVVLISFILLGVSSIIMINKSGRTSFPDAGLPYGTAIIFETATANGVNTGWNSVVLYFSNIANPFIKVFGLEKPMIIDTPVVMAQLLDGVPKSEKKYYHYPTLWYSDAYISFGYSGLFLAVIWGAICCIWESVISKNPVILSLSLTFFIWHAYMLIRGSTAIATVPFSYSVYIVFLAYLFSRFLLLLRGGRGYD